ncbi:MAG: hypothetical protein ACTHJT_16710 [Cytophaga sp.]|uniref:hypothetical protein n=1 Tax=Cytophaga sp. TaxID=29535 RepID=UPI003F7D080A
MFIFSITTFAQQEIISASWTQINSGIPRDRFVPRELFKINDSTLYLGCRYYLLRVFKDSLRLELKVNGSENVIRSVVGYDSTIYVSAKGNLVLEKMNDVDWVDIMNGYTARGDINWEMVEYNSELIYSSWPRWLEYYNFEPKRGRLHPCLISGDRELLRTLKRRIRICLLLYMAEAYTKKTEQKMIGWIAIRACLKT